MVMYKEFLSNIREVTINNTTIKDAGYTSCNISHSQEKNIKNLKFQSFTDKLLNKMKILFLFPKNSIHIKNIVDICNSSLMTYEIIWSTEEIEKKIKNDFFDIVVVNRDSNEFDIDKFILNTMTEVKNQDLKVVSFSKRLNENFPELLEKGYHEQWINYNDDCALKNYLESYILNQFQTYSKLKNNLKLWEIFNNLEDRVAILNHNFQIIVFNVQFQRMINLTFSGETDLNWFKLHQVPAENIQIIKNELNKKHKWIGAYSCIGDHLSTHDRNDRVMIRPLDSHHTHYIVNINIMSTKSLKCEETKSSFSTDISSSRNFESFFNQNSIRIESPIIKIMQIINSVEEFASPLVNQQLTKVIEILSSNDLFVTKVDSLKSDIMSLNLIDGLLTNNATIFTQTQARRLSSSISKTNHKKRISLINTIEEVSVHEVNEDNHNINVLLERYNLWSFDIFRLESLTDFKPLRHIGMKIFQRFEMGFTLKIDSKVFRNWLYIIESHYNESNTYHNSTHAADVLQSSAWFLERSKINEIFDNFDDAISIIAAIIHDLGHPGRTNLFLINCNHNLAILYNDTAVLENHHAAFAFRLTIKDDRVNIFKNLNRDDYYNMRHGIIDAVLATEMAKHYEHLTKFNNILIKSIDIDEDILGDETKASKTDVLSTPENKAIIRRMLIKCSDVNNPARPFLLSQEWANRISEEYFKQTDDEIALNLPVVMPQFNRTICSIPQSQISFIEIFLEHMFSMWNKFADTEELITNLEENKILWKAQVEKLYLSTKTKSDLQNE